MTDDTKPKPVPGQPLPPNPRLWICATWNGWGAKKLQPVPRVLRKVNK